MRYLVEIPEREHEACRLLVQFPFLSERLFAAFGISSAFSWYVLRLRTERLIATLHGDIDILAGPLCWSDESIFDDLVSAERAAWPERHDSWNYVLAARKLAVDGGIKWPPTLAPLVGVEAKCAYLPSDVATISETTLKSTKSSPQKTSKVRREISNLLRLGIDHVALLDIIANPPATACNGWAWSLALDIASSSSSAMSAILANRLEPSCEAAHWVWAIGSVAGGDEWKRGAGAPVQLRASRGNSQVSQASPLLTRSELEWRLASLFGSLQPPTTVPAVFLDCRRCGNIHTVPWPSVGFRTTREAGCGLAR